MMNDLRDHSVRKETSVELINICKRGLADRNAVYKAMCSLADEVGMPGESSAQKFLKAYASGDLNRIPDGGRLLTEYNKLGTGDLPFHFSVQTGDEDPEQSVCRVTVRSDDEPRTNSQYQPYSYSSSPRVISPTNSTALDSWNDAIKRIMEVSKVNYTQAGNIAQQDPALRPVWEAAKSSMGFSPLLTKKAPHGWGGMPDPPPSDNLDDEEDEDDLGREGAHRRPRLRKRDLPAIALALKKHYGSGGGGVPR
jgi:hypothetical protein